MSNTPIKKAKIKKTPKKLRSKKAKPNPIVNSTSSGIYNIHSGSSPATVSGTVLTTDATGTSIWNASSGTLNVGRQVGKAYVDDPYSFDSEEVLELNWDKVKETIGEESWKELINEALKEYIHGSYPNSRTEDFLRHVGLLDTKRVNNLNNILGADEEG